MPGKPLSRDRILRRNFWCDLHARVQAQCGFSLANQVDGFFTEPAAGATATRGLDDLYDTLDLIRDPARDAYFAHLERLLP